MSIGPYLNSALSANPSLYIHLPFCRSRCSYCDFYSCSLEKREESPKDLFREYTNKLIVQEKILRKEFSIEDYRTVYLGGGTPSLLPPGELNRLFKELDFSRTGKEITIEVNPESLTGELLASYGQMGINRISMGIQSLRPEILGRMGRLAQREEVLEAVSLLKEWPGTWSVDYIFAFPGQTGESQLDDLRELLSLDPPHFSLYQLTVEEGTALYRNLDRKTWKLPSEEEMEDAWEDGMEMIEKAGYERYEISSFCRDRRYSKHNLAYWETTPWLGLGAGGASMMDETTRFTGKTLDEFLSSGYEDLISTGRFYEREERSAKDRITEDIMMGLRIKWGVGREKLVSILGNTDPFQLFERTLSKWEGKLILDDRGLLLNSRGLDWHSAVMVDLLLDLDNFFDYNSSL